MHKLLLMLFTGVVLVGCGQETNDEATTDSTDQTEEIGSDENTEMATVTIDLTVAEEAGGPAEEEAQEVEVEEDAILLDVMNDQYDIDETGGFVEEINGYEQDEENELYWIFYVNEEMTQVGVEDYELQDEDTIEWQLEPLD